MVVYASAEAGRRAGAAPRARPARPVQGEFRQEGVRQETPRAADLTTQREEIG
jgi:hypothetical protein